MTVTYRANAAVVGAGTSPTTVSKPTGTAEGDLLILLVGQSAAKTITPPSGFVALDGATTTANTPHLKVYTKVAGGSEPATYDITWTGTGAAIAATMVAMYSSIGVVLAINAATTQYNAATDRLVPGVTTTVANALILAFAALQDAFSTTPPAGPTERWDGSGGGQRLWGATDSYVGPGSYAGFNCTGNDTNNNVATIAIVETPDGLASSDISSGVPTVGSPLLGQEHALVATGIVSGTPTVGEPLLEEIGNLDPPSGLTATAVSATQIDLEWVDTNISENGYEIQRSLTGAGGWSVIDTVAADETTYSDTGLDPETTYYYRVRAFAT